jgi:hypothetical protein
VKPSLHCQSFCDHSRNFALVNSTFWRICKKCSMELTQCFKGRGVHPQNISVSLHSDTTVWFISYSRQMFCHENIKSLLCLYFWQNGPSLGCVGRGDGGRNNIVYWRGQHVGWGTDPPPPPPSLHVKRGPGSSCMPSWISFQYLDIMSYSYLCPQGSRTADSDTATLPSSSADLALDQRQTK